MGSAAEEILAEKQRQKAEQEGFGTQFLQGFVKTGAGGYVPQPDAPADLPLSGQVGRFSGEMAGFATVLNPVEAGLEGAGLVPGLGKSLATGAIYGFAKKPDEAQAGIIDRLKSGAEDAAEFGALHLGGEAIKAAGRRIFGGAEGAAATLPGGSNLDLSIFKSPADLEAYKIANEGLAEGFTPPKGPPPGPPGSPPPSFGSDGEMMDAFLQAKQKEDLQRATGMEERFRNVEVPPEETQNILKSNEYEGKVNSWAKDVVNNIPPEADMLEKAGKIATTGDIEGAAKQMMVDSGSHNLGQTPSSEDSLVENLVPKIPARAALETNIENLVKKNDLPIEDVMTATQVQEPINFLMSRGVNFEDASDLVDSMAERAKMPFKADEILAEAGQQSQGPMNLLAGNIPPYEAIKRRSFSPDEVYDLFYNVPIKGPEAIKHGLVELNPASGGLHLTEKGYAFVKQYNPEGLSGDFPTFMPKKILGAIRGQGYSNINLSPEELKTAGIKMGTSRALQEGFIRPAEKKGVEIPGQYQLESKGAGMLAGGRGANANIDLKQFDLQTGLRALPGDTEAIAAKAAERETNKLLFSDIWDQTQKLGEKC